MNFIIEKIKGEIKHDFIFTLLQSLDFQKWNGNEINIKSSNLEDLKICKSYIPIGSVDFVHKYMTLSNIKIPLPINIPLSLNKHEFTCRNIVYGNEDVVNKIGNNKHVKSTDKVKGYTEIFEHGMTIHRGNYQISELINIDSEWRCFIHRNELVGLQNYNGDFTLFPNIKLINKIIKEYYNAPIAYTLDVGVNNNNTFIIEIHNFYSCGLYGFSNHKILPFMFSQWWYNYINKQIKTKWQNKNQ